jgi:hypothetical protein
VGTPPVVILSKADKFTLSVYGKYIGHKTTHWLGGMYVDRITVGGVGKGFVTTRVSDSGSDCHEIISVRRGRTVSDPRTGIPYVTVRTLHGKTFPDYNQLS